MANIKISLIFSSFPLYIFSLKYFLIGCFHFFLFFITFFYFFQINIIMFLINLISVFKYWLELFSTFVGFIFLPFMEFCFSLCRVLLIWKKFLIVKNTILIFFFLKKNSYLQSWINKIAIRFPLFRLNYRDNQLHKKDNVI